MFYVIVVNNITNNYALLLLLLIQSFTFIKDSKICVKMVTHLERFSCSIEVE